MSSGKSMLKDLCSASRSLKIMLLVEGPSELGCKKMRQPQVKAQQLFKSLILPRNHS